MSMPTWPRCVRLLDAAAATGAELAVLARVFATTCRCTTAPTTAGRWPCRWDGDWLGTLALRAAHRHIYAALAVTVPPSRRPSDAHQRADRPRRPYHRYPPTKQMLMGNERAHLSAGGGVQRGGPAPHSGRSGCTRAWTA